MGITPTSRGLLRSARLALGTGALLLLSLSGAITQAATEELDAIVAVVNDDVVVRSELDKEIRLVIPQMQQRGTPLPPEAQLRKQVLDRLILKHLQQQRAKELGIRVDDATLNEAMSNIANRNGLTLPELQVTLEAGGIDFDDFREDTRSQILTSRLQSQEVVKKIQVTDQEVDRFLAKESSRLVEREQVRLQHILIALPENPSPAQIKAAESKAKRLVTQLRAGADFASVAVRESDGRNALEGGDLGWFEMGAVPSLVSDLAFTLAEGEISDPLRSPSGFHIIKLREIKAAAPKSVTQTHARHILVRTNEIVSDEDAKRRLSQLRTRIQGGDDFETLARAHSDDTGSALKGGDLGWLNPGDTVPEFEETMNDLAPDQVSLPFKSPFGWHIVQVLERRDQDTSSDIMRIKAREALQRRKAEEATEEWLRQLRDEAYVEIRLGNDY
ncbi:Survival protein SurA precursor (Peptidyl-prolyl cis-trans isomerase SurA) [Imhoffiella purpurea]|uniref:Chaperone SurA n=1 Tax=Imhoffiella purpurea TaxID=1249627 RepID=W9VBI5_9GAMM|nr:peptidylprolyl isomerase [Imhoffiella purpurea]EXJ14311.1 Survival protein SurA precursor (Peptidyl-prolyl cis-trans isomerase SurA) [Imhoffiella purpurea]